MVLNAALAPVVEVRPESTLAIVDRFADHPEAVRCDVFKVASFRYVATPDIAYRYWLLVNTWLAAEMP